MGRNEEQPSLWSQREPVPDELRIAFERARTTWLALRFNPGIGSPEEESAWTLFRDISDRLWERRSG